jgi:CHAT domain-containing protein/Tfp pilus assembly protein PilF
MKRKTLSPTHQEFSSHGVSRRAAILLCAALSLLQALGQSDTHPAGTGESTPILLSGIVVEEVGTEYWERPVLREKDVLVSWTRGDSHGKFESPFSLWWMYTEQHPLGTVGIDGLRDGQTRTWILTNNDFSTKARPNFVGAWLEQYDQARDLERAGKVTEAAARWLTMARSISGGPMWVPVWLRYHAGRVLAAHQLWRQADKAFAEAIVTAQDDPALRVPIERFWGRSLWDRGEWTKADDLYLKILSDVRSAGKGWAEAELLRILGINAVLRGNYRQAREYSLSALAMNQSVSPEGPGIAWILTNLGSAALGLGDLDQAESRFLTALELHRKAGDDLGIDHALSQLAYVAIYRADLIRADKYLSEALAIETRTGNVSTQALWGLVSLAGSRGESARAKRLCQRLLALDKRNGDLRSLAADLVDLGVLYRDEGHLTQAERYVRQGLRVALRAAPKSEYAAAALGNLGEIALMRGRVREAEKYLAQSLALEEQLEDNATGFMDVAERLDCLGEIAKRRRRFDQAESYYKRAAKILAKMAPNGIDYAESLAGLAAVYRIEGNLQASRDYYERALKALEIQTARLGGSNEIRAGFRAKHEKIYRAYVDLLLRLNQPELAFEIVERSRARTLLETLAAAHADIRKGADPELIAREHSLQATLKVKSARRTHLLNDQRNEEELKAVEKEITSVTSEYQDVEAQIRSSSPAYAALTQPQPLSLTEIQKQLLDPDTVLLEYSLGEERSHVFAVSNDSLLVEELPARSMVEAASRRVYDLLTARNQHLKNESPAARMARIARADADYPAAAARLSRMALGPVATQIAGKRLLIVSDGALHYVSFAALPLSAPGMPSSPLAAEHEIVNLPSASVLAVLRRERMGRESAPRTVAVLADPVFDAGDTRVKSSGGNSHIARESSRASIRAAAAQPESSRALQETNEPTTQEDSENTLALVNLTRSAADLGWRSRRRGEVYLPRLTFSRREADAIAAVTPPGQALEALDFQASRATALGGNLAHYRVVHLATHALLNSKHPELSGLVFSLVDEQARPQNGFLDLEDIYNMNLPAELVVLSACETGLGKEISGEGLVGLTRGFMYAGASRVMASLWKIDDRATAELMGHFYRAMLGQGMRPAAALRAAQLEMQKNKRWSSPYFWAAFEIQGEWK